MANNIKIKQPPNVEEVIKRPPNIYNANDALRSKSGRMTAMAARITKIVGSPKFFLFIVSWIVIWMGWNIVAPKEFVFDPPYSFTIWLFISNLLQIVLMPLLLVGQNLESAKSQEAINADYEIAKETIERLNIALQHMEFQTNMIDLIAQKMGLTCDDLVKELIELEDKMNADTSRPEAAR